MRFFSSAFALVLSAASIITVVNAAPAAAAVSLQSLNEVPITNFIDNNSQVLSTAKIAPFSFTVENEAVAKPAGFSESLGCLVGKTGCSRL